MPSCSFSGSPGRGGRGARRAAAPRETETVRKIVAALDSMEPERARFIAAFAFILCRVARADLHISPRKRASWSAS